MVVLIFTDSVIQLMVLSLFDFQEGRIKEKISSIHFSIKSVLNQKAVFQKMKTLLFDRK